VSIWAGSTCPELFGAPARTGGICPRTFLNPRGIRSVNGMEEGRQTFLPVYQLMIRL
jgi:hypothetical protein